MKVKVKFASKYIDSLRKLIFEEQPNIIGNIYKKNYRGEKIKHITIEVKNKYRSIPLSAYNRAIAKQEEKKLVPYTEREDVKMFGKNFVQKKFVGKFTQDEIKNITQEMSNKLAQEGKNGLISASIRFFGEEKGLWRGGKLKAFGQNVELFDNYDEIDIQDNQKMTAFTINILNH